MRNLQIRSFHALWLNFPEHSSRMSSSDTAVLQPQFCRNKIGLGFSAFARHYSRNHCYFLLLKVLRCFSSLRSPLSLIGNRPSTCWVAPFGYPRIYAYLQLPEAFRSLSRPSSPPIAKASTIRPYLLLYFLWQTWFYCLVALSNFRSFTISKLPSSLHRTALYNQLCLRKSMR